MMLSNNITKKITSDDECVITLEDIEAESARLGLPGSEIIRLAFMFLIDYRFTSKGY